MLKQRTLASPLDVRGQDPRGGERGFLILPAGAGHGVTFVRRDLPAGEGLFVARWHELSSSERCATLSNPHGHQLAGISPLLGTFYLLGLDNVRVELHGAALPLLDGAALSHLYRVVGSSLEMQREPRDIMVVRRPVRLLRGERWAEVLPAISPRVTVYLDRPDLEPHRRATSISLAKAGPSWGSGQSREPLAQISPRPGQGPPADIAPVPRELDGATKSVLEVIGDLALGGAPLIAHYRGHNPCCHLNAALLRLVHNDRSAWYTLSEDVL